jgi:hypothetical protein
MKKSNDIGNRTRELPACSIVPQPTTPPRATVSKLRKFIFRECVLYRKNPGPADRLHGSATHGDPEAVCREVHDIRVNTDPDLGLSEENTEM